MKMPIRKNIYNMPQGPPNPGFMQEKVQKGDFLKKPLRELKFFCCFRFLWIFRRPGTLNWKRLNFCCLKSCTSSVLWIVRYDLSYSFYHLGITVKLGSGGATGEEKSWRWGISVSNPVQLAATRRLPRTAGAGSNPGRGHSSHHHGKHLFSNFHENLKIRQNTYFNFSFFFIYLGETLQQPLVINNHNYSANDVEVNDEQDL